ncbi:MAG: type II toxin-antitoxin system Phd/YefM family antitoxin [Longimicrobiales bacterium]
MRVVGIRDLKDRLSRYVRLAESGEATLVTDRGRVVAELGPPGSAQGGLRDLAPGLRGLAERGALRVGTGNDPELYPRLPGALHPGEVQRLLDEERGP